MASGYMGSTRYMASFLFLLVALILHFLQFFQVTLRNLRDILSVRKWRILQLIVPPFLATLFLLLPSVATDPASCAALFAVLSLVVFVVDFISRMVFSRRLISMVSEMNSVREA